MKIDRHASHIFIQKSPLFSKLSKKQLALVMETMHCTSFKSREMLVHQGEEAHRFFLLKSGLIKLNRFSEQGTEKILRIVKPGETFGTALMFLKKRIYPVHAETIKAGSAFSFNCADYLSILRNAPETCFQIMGLFSKRLVSQIDDIDKLCLQSAPRRLIRYLVDKLPTKTPTKNTRQQTEITLDLPKHVIASHLSIKPETLSRILNDLVKKELITVESRIILVHDIEALRLEGGCCGFESRGTL